MINASRLALCLSSFVALAAVACSGAPDPTPLSDTSACGKKADANMCDDCCLAPTPTAVDAADKAEGDCMCAPAACQTACAASVCSETDNMNQPTAACETCLDAHQPECVQKFDAACNADAACKAAVSCMTMQCDPLAAMMGGSSGSSGSSSGGAAFGGVSRAASVASFTARMMARADRQ